MTIWSPSKQEKKQEFTLSSSGDLSSASVYVVGKDAVKIVPGLYAWCNTKCYISTNLLAYTSVGKFMGNKNN